jgi:DNA-binding transcriptional ArsR family regulator
MSRTIPSAGRLSRTGGPKHAPAPLFAAMGDETRLYLIGRLSTGQRGSISQLTRGSRLTRQAVTKHLRVLENAGMVRSFRDGRENLFEFNPEPLQAIKSFLDSVSEQWDEALARLKSFVES